MGAWSGARSTRPINRPTSRTLDTAAKASTRPHPVRASGRSDVRARAVRVMTDRTSAAVRPGLAPRMSAATPATWGVAMLVPLARASPPPGTVEVMAMPGATISGLTPPDSDLP